MGSLTLSELERLAEYDMGHESKERLLTYIGWMGCLLQDLDPAFKTELIRDYGFYLQAQEKEETTA